MTSPFNSLLARGLLALAVGAIAIAWPGVTICALVIIFAIAAFAGAGLNAATAFAGDGAGSVFGYVLLALIDLAAGIAALAWPGITALVLTLFIGIWAVIGGVTDFFLAFVADTTEGQQALRGIGGLVSVAFGVVLLARPTVGAISLALLFGLFSLAYGVSSLAASASVRRDGRTLSGVAG